MQLGKPDPVVHADRLYGGGGGTDYLIGKKGVDYLEGGTGLDIYEYNGYAANIFALNLTGGNDGNDTIRDMDCEIYSNKNKSLHNFTLRGYA